MNNRKSKRTQEQRRRDTQDAVLSAAIQVLIEDGYAKFSASRVAAKARVSRGAQEHYFPTKNALVTAAARHAMKEAVKHAELLARHATKSSDPLGKFLKDSGHFFFSPVYRSMTEIAFAARYDRTLSRVYRPIVKDARAILDKIWVTPKRATLFRTFICAALGAWAGG
jgi:AcrR family transcriptional regulator